MIEYQPPHKPLHQEAEGRIPEMETQAFKDRVNQEIESALAGNEPIIEPSTTTIGRVIGTLPEELRGLYSMSVRLAAEEEDLLQRDADSDTLVSSFAATSTVKDRLMHELSAAMPAYEFGYRFVVDKEWDVVIPPQKEIVEAIFEEEIDPEPNTPSQ